MGAILALILPLLAKLPGMAGDYFKQKAEIQMAQLQTEKELEQARTQLAKELAKAQLEWQKEALRVTGAYFKYFTFIMWFGPYMTQIVYPPLGKQIFENMQGMPEWYAQSCVLIMFTIWGIAVSAPVVSNIFEGMKHFFASRREYKLEKAKIFAKVKSSWFPKGMNQKQVNELDEAIDEGTIQ